MRVAYLKLKRERGMNMLCDYTKFVADIVYGDDDIKSIHCSIIDWFNQETITKVLATIGLTYTDETKTGVLLPYKSLKDVYFLKRKFVLLDDGTYIAPMDVENILEICNWIRGKTFKQSTIENCEQCLKELTLHPREIYDTYGTKMRNACFEVGLELSVPTYTEMWQEFLFNRQLYEQVEYEPLY